MEAMSLPNIQPIRDASPFFGKGPLFRLVGNYKFHLIGGPESITYTIPNGYEFDKASIPSIFWGWPFNYTPDGLCTVPALEHDFLCDILKGGSPYLYAKIGWVRRPTSSAVHEHFRLRLLEEGVRPGKARLMGAAVRWFGPKGKAYFWQ